MAEEYDISRAFERIEEELIASMIRNMDRHRAEESAYGYEWSQWQAEQLRSLEHYRAENQRKFGRQFPSLNQRIENAIRGPHTRPEAWSRKKKSWMPSDGALPVTVICRMP